MIKLKAQDGIFENSIGIGTTNPAVQLNIKNQSTTSNKVQIGFTSQDGTQNAAITHTDEAGEERLALSCGGFNFEHFVLDNNGNVGIGTTSPDFKLTVDNGIGNEGLKVIAGNNGDSAESVFEAWNNKVNGSAPELLFKIRGDGNVGIGTTNPALTTPPGHATGPMFGLKNSLSASMSLFRDDTTIVNGNAIGGIFFYGNGSANPASPVSAQELASIECFADEAHDDNAHGSSLSFLTNNGTTLTKRMLIDKDGNVGIGTASPFAKLGVELPVNADLTTGLFVRNKSSHSGSGGSNIASFHGPNDYAMQVKCDGRVGIGTTDPQNKLTVQSDSISNTLTEAVSIIGGNYANSTNAESFKFFHQTQVSNTNRGVAFKSINGLLTIQTIVTSDNSSFANNILLQPDAGNVGIGTTNPDLQLDVNGGIQMRGDQFWFKGGAFRFIDRNTGSSLERMRIDSSGNVGIGTTNPALTTPPGHATGPMFGLKNSLSASMSLFRDDTTIVDGNAIGGIFFYGNGSANPASPVSAQELASIECFADEAHDDNAHGSSLSFLTNNGTTLTKRMLIDKDGNVGIGTASPGSPLHIFGQTNNLGGLMLAAAGTNIDSLRFWIDSSSTAHINRGGNEAISITNTRNVGIGTTSPAVKLEVVNSGSSNIAQFSSTSSNLGGYILIQGSSEAGSAGNLFFGNGRTLVTGSSDASAGIRASTELLFSIGAAEKMRISSGGNVGIGTTNPGAYKLYINGTARVSGGDVTSDDRVKHNEENIVGAIETLSKITPKKYIKTTEMYDADHDFELDADGNPVNADGEPLEHSIEAGVIAQQVLEVPELAFMVSPEGVGEDGNVTSPHGLNYNSLFTYAIAAIQEQQTIIEDLKARIEILENK